MVWRSFAPKSTARLRAPLWRGALRGLDASPSAAPGRILAEGLLHRFERRASQNAFELRNKGLHGLS